MLTPFAFLKAAISRREFEHNSPAFDAAGRRLDDHSIIRDATYAILSYNSQVQMFIIIYRV